MYEARVEASGAVVAIKVAHLATGSALQREVDALRVVGPPHVPEVLESGLLADGRPYVAMGRPPHPTLADLLARRARPMRIERFRRAADAILGALQAVHRRGLVHLDLKPEHILLDLPRPHAWLIDFGLAELLDPSRPSEQPRIPEPFRGTVEYASPEQCAGSGAIDARTDLYAAGAIFYEMLTGHPPFAGSAAEVKQAHLAHRPARPAARAAVPDELERIVLRCLAKNPVDRFASVEELRRALAATNVSGARTWAPTPPRLRALADHERRSVGLVFFESEADPGHVQSMIDSLSGQLGDVRRRSYVAVFGHESDENPVALAVRAARGLVSAGLATRVLVDIDRVAVQVRPDGTRRHVSGAFLRLERFPSTSDPSGVLITVAAAEVAELSLEMVPVRAGIVGLGPRSRLPEVMPVESPVGLLIGRDQPLRDLVESALASIERGRPAIATVIGEAGHGKSQLLRALVEQLRRRAGFAQLVVLNAREPLAGEVDQTLGAVLRRFLHLPEQRPDDAGRGLIVDRLGPSAGEELWAPAALALGWLSHDAPEVRALAVAPGTLRSAAARAAALGMQRAAHDQPVLFVLDDARFVGQGVLEALELATAAGKQVPLWVCVAARPSFDRRAPAWGARAAERCVVRLAALEPASAAELCRRLLEPARHLPAEVIERIVSITQGIPLHVVELIRALKARGAVRRHARGDAWYVAADELGLRAELPLIEWLTHRELDAMPASLVAHARLAALLGGDLTVRELAGVLQELDREGLSREFPLDAAVGIERLVDQGLLRVHRGRVRFVHALVRAAIERSVPEAVRRPAHHAAFRFYCDEPGLPEFERLARLARHAAGAGLRAQALASYLQLAEWTRNRHEYLDAEALYGEALALATDDEAAARVVALRGRGLMRYRLSRYDDALADLDHARRLAEARGDAPAVCELLLDAATALDWSDDYRRSSELVEQAAGIEGSRSAHAEARLLLGLGRSAFRFDRRAEAAALLERAAASAGRLGDAGYETLVISDLLRGYILAELGSLDESERVFERVIALCEARGDRLHLGAALGNRSMLWIGRNDERRLLADLRRLLDLARELGNGRMEQQAHFYLALFLHWLGESGPARDHARCAVEIDERRHGQAARPEALLLLARVGAGAGDTAAARELLDEIHGRQQRALQQGDRELALLPAEEVLCAMIDLLVRSGTEAEWSELTARARAQLVGPDRIEFFFMRGVTAAREGNPGRAREALAEARQIAAAVPNVLRARIEGMLDRLPPP